MKKLKAFFEKIKNRERGAVVVEATIALTTFIFAIYIILSIVDICYVQAKMGIALNSAAKEMSQYAYMYEVFGVSDMMDQEGGENSSSKLIAPFGEFLASVSKNTANFSSEISDVFQGASDQVSSDDAAELGSNLLGMGLAQVLVKKNLNSYEGESADAFLRKLHVKDGFSGLNFLSTTFLTDAAHNKVNLVMHYEVEVVRLLGTSYTFKFIQKAGTKAWTSGVSSASGSTSNAQTSTVWDTGWSTRGKTIVNNEKKGYVYTSSGDGFHAFDPKNNEFVKIRTIDTTTKSNQTSADIEKQINQTYQTLKDSVDKLGENIPLQKDGKDTTAKSDPNTRNYKVVLVVPDSSNMETINKAIADFKKKNPGVEVQVKTGYGDPTPKATKPADSSSEATPSTADKTAA